MANFVFPDSDPLCYSGFSNPSKHVLQQGASETVPDANSSSWAARNPNWPVLTPCVPLNAAQKARANAQRASHKISLQQRKEAEDGLHTAIQQLLSEHNEKIDTLALERGVTADKEVNADQPGGAKYSLYEIQDMNMSVRTTNSAAVHDVQSTLDNVFKIATWFGTDNVMDFWEDVLQTEADEIMRKLEQWACVSGRSINERETVQNMQHICTRLLNSGLRTLIKRCDIRINYTNFNTAIKEKLGIDLRGWPEDVLFQSPTSINDLNTLRKLRDVLREGSCHWFHMTPRQRDEFVIGLAARHKRGEVIGKPRKKRSDAGVARKQKGKENGHPTKRVQASRTSAQAPKSSEFVDTSEEEDTSEGEA
ncbi:uncharacterized protein EDB91DRAFT_1088833 [Suillus paluster]|uniref:uncharacterized protein n=1 Tax=Suillus paluster TaxID=48578 RepID=UPI001B870CF2|nr:uncharacterized protein EDB91DRAFT_1088833 [Suillus paluster]KAG1720457.1 hypothetical protein EDB91DRAFT_1088833 [Suillus paluster]